MRSNKVTLFITTFFWSLCFVCAAVSSDPSDLDMQKYGQLVFSHVFFRHGDRTPILQNPGDKYDISYWPEGWGELTNLGKQQQYALGQWLRRRYNNFLSNTYNASDIHVQSSDVDRTLMSVQANLAGLYPPQGKQIWNDKLLWQPIPVSTEPTTMDELIAGSVPSPCPSYENAYNKYMASTEMLRYGQWIQPIYNYLTNKTGTVVNSYITVLLIRDSWLCESIHNLPLPEWSKSLYPNNPDFYQAALKYYYLATGTKFLAKFSAGFLLKDILDRFTSKTQRTLSPDRKMWMYSTHDSTVFSFLNGLGISDNEFTPYTATVILELRYYKNEYYVQIFYKNSDITPNPIKIPGCGISCPLSKLYKIYDNILPKYDFATECQIIG